jgi:glycosyltransferase involved in cell wall biosynthesis
MGAQRIDLTRTFNMVLTLGETIAILVVLHLHYGLVALSTIIASSEFLYIVLSFAASRKVLPQVRIRLSNFTKSTYPELAHFAGSYQLLNLLEVGYQSIWPIVLLKSFGPEAAGISALALRIVSATMIGMDAFCTPVQAGAAKVFASEQGERVRSFLAKAFKVTLLVSVLPLTLIAVVGAQIIHAWTGQTGPLFASAVNWTALTNFFRALLALEVILYRSAGNALRDNILQVLRIIAALSMALFAKKLGFVGVLAGMSMIEFAGAVFMFYVLSHAFQELSLRMIWKDAARVTAAAAAIVGLGVVCGWVVLPLHLTDRMAVTVRLGQVAVGCLIAAWPALWLTGAVSPDEWRTIFQAVLPGKELPAVAEPALSNFRRELMTEKQLYGDHLVSVVIPTYNRTQQTFTAVESVLAQTYPNLEIIVVDDGSTNGSGEVVQRFVNTKTSDLHPILFFSQPNQGASVARNTGIANARGEYVAFLDSDDIWVPEKLEWQMRALEQFKNECGACFTDARLVNDAGLDVSSFQVHGRHYEQTIGIERDALRTFAESFSGFWVSSLIVRTDLVRQIGGFSADISFVEDRDLHFRLSLATSIAYVNKQLIQTDRNPSPPGSTCRPWDKVEVQFRQQQHLYEKWLRMGTELPLEIRRIIEQDLGALHSHWANWYLENGRYEEARQAVSNAVRHRISLGTTVKWALTWVAPAFASRIAPKTRPIGTGGHAS